MTAKAGASATGATSVGADEEGDSVTGAAGGEDSVAALLEAHPTRAHMRVAAESTAMGAELARMTIPR
jgi:hypothetical protein